MEEGLLRTGVKRTLLESLLVSALGLYVSAFNDPGLRRGMNCITFQNLFL